MSVEDDIRALLAARASLTAQVGDRIALVALPEGRKPPAVLYAVQHDQQRGLGGDLHGDVCSVTVECWAASGDKAAALADEVEAAFGSVPSVAQVNGRQTDYDDETGLHAAVVAAVWIV